MTREAVLIAGPTASGKSRYAIDIAKNRRGVIVNADSMQVYADLRVLTSRPPQSDEELVEHRLYGHIDGAETYSTGRWLDDLKQVLQQIWDADKLPVLTGGTGLYFKAAEFGLAEVPEVPDKLREEIRHRLVKLGPEALHDDLQKIDAKSASGIKPADGQRIARALEVYAATGVPLSQFHATAAHNSVLSGVKLEKKLIMPDRQLLYQRINNRFARMVDEGALEEVETLRARQLDPNMPVMKAIGVRALGAYLDGNSPLEEAIQTASRETRNYAKRQMTWARNQMTGWDWI